MTVEEARERYELFLMGALDEPERTEVRERITQDREGAAAAARVVAALAGIIDLVEPPARLRARLVGAQPGGRRWPRSLGWAALVALAILSIPAANRLMEEQTGRIEAENEIRRLGAELAVKDEMLALVAAPDTILRHSTAPGPVPPQSRVFLHPSRGVLLLASHLPALRPGRAYQMWLIPQSGDPVPAGLLPHGNGGTAAHFLRQAVDLPAIKAVAVTEEPAGGSRQPTSTPFLVTPLGG